MKKITDFANTIFGDLKAFIAACIIGIGVLYIGLTILKGIKELKDKKIKEGLIHLGMGAIIAIVIAMGVGGLMKLVELYGPTDDIIPKETIPRGGVSMMLNQLKWTLLK